MRILIAEDDGVTRQVLARMLCKWGHEVVIAYDGSQAWEALQKPDAPNLVILDWMMPGIDGLELCRRLRTLKRDICPYIILLTALNNKKDLLQGFSAGADDYVTKPFDPEELNARIRAGERIVDLQIESLAARDTLRRLATFDFLTGLRNRAAILAELKRECDRYPRTEVSVNVVMVDVDHFKQVNDRFGHQVGDRVLAELAKRMASEVRSYEAVGRYGGEEFLIVLSGCDLEGAVKQAERVRRVVGSRDFDIWGVKIPVTVSLGVASSTQLEHPDVESLIEMADAAMYAAKLAGRNRVAVAATAPTQSPALPDDSYVLDPTAASPACQMLDF
jgi:two-component system, cell cycle response regulator